MHTTVIIGRFAERRAAVQRSHPLEQWTHIRVNALFVCLVLFVYLVIGACFGWWLCRHFEG